MDKAIENERSDLLEQLIKLHKSGHRSQHWFDLHQRDTNRYVTFTLYRTDEPRAMITGHGSTFTEALKDSLDLWNKAIETLQPIKLP